MSNFRMMKLGKGNPIISDATYIRFSDVKKSMQQRRVMNNKQLSKIIDNNSNEYQLTAKTADIMLLSCMDFRLIDDTVDVLNKLDARNNYDQFILAGSSLGYNTSLGYDNNGQQIAVDGKLSKKDTWTNVFNTHIELAIILHNIKYVYIIDHLDCGAYNAWYGNGNVTKENEVQLHLDNLNECKNYIIEKFPQLAVKIFIIDLYGNLKEY